MSLGRQEYPPQDYPTNPNPILHATPTTDTSGPISNANSLIGGVIGLSGAPTFKRGENVIQIIKRDHQFFKDEYAKYQAATSLRSRQEHAWALVKAIVQHSEVEQLLVYPLLKMRGEKEREGDFLHDNSLSEHQHIRELLDAVDQTDVDDVSYPKKLQDAMDAVTAHGDEEEQEVLPVIERNFKIEELERLGKAFEKHKATAVTRPHPHAPAQGPLAAAANILTKPIDLARDAIRDVTKKAGDEIE